MTSRTAPNDSTPTRPVSRRALLIGVLATPTLAALLAACGDPSTEPAGAGPSTDPSLDPSGGTEIQHPTDAGSAVIRITYEGGFVPQGHAFVNTPTLIVSGDGRVFVPGAVAEIYPGPLLAPIGVRSITEAGVQRLLALADRAGLLASPPDYSSAADTTIADAPNTVVTISANGSTYVHRAYALGIATGDQTGTAGESTSERQALLGFVQMASDLPAAAGAETLGEETMLAHGEFRLQSYVITDADIASIEPAPMVVDWPDSVGVDLASANECARVSADAARTLFADANQNTFFRDDDATYRLAVAGVLPGDPSPC